MEPLPVLVVSGDPLARAGLVALVAGRPELTLLGQVGPREAALRARGAGALLWELEPDAVAGALEAAAALAPVVVLAAGEEAVGEALRAGARGVVGREADVGVVAAALQAAARGLTVLEAPVAAALLRPHGGLAGFLPLTPREHEVLRLLAEGLSNKAIAGRLGISDHTAKFHVNAILGKLGAGSRAEAIVRAARAGLVAL